MNCFYLQHFWHQIYEDFFLPYQPVLQYSRYRLDVVQFSSFLTQPRSHIDPHRSGLSPTRQPHSDASHKFHATTSASHQLAVNLGSSHNPLLKLDHSLEWFTELRQMLYVLFTVFIYKGYKMNSQMIRCIGWGPKGSGAQQLALGCTTLAACEYVKNSGALQASSFRGLVWRFHCIGKVDYISQWAISSSSPLPRGQGVGLKVPFFLFWYWVLFKNLLTYPYRKQRQRLFNNNIQYQNRKKKALSYY